MHAAAAAPLKAGVRCRPLRAATRPQQAPLLRRAGGSWGNASSWPPARSPMRGAPWQSCQSCPQCRAAGGREHAAMRVSGALQQAYAAVGEFGAPPPSHACAVAPAKLVNSARSPQPLSHIVWLVMNEGRECHDGCDHLCHLQLCVCVGGGGCACVQKGCVVVPYWAESDFTGSRRRWPLHAASERTPTAAAPPARPLLSSRRRTWFSKATAVLSAKPCALSRR